MSDTPLPLDSSSDPNPEPTPSPEPMAPEVSSPRPRPWNWRPKVRWFAAEYLIVVLGVLTAVGINTWWADRDARTRERLILEDLREDFAFNKSEIQHVRDLSDRLLIQYNQLATISADDLAGMSPDSIYTYVESTFSSDTFDPVTGSLDALIASGDLGLIQDRVLRERLTSFMEALRDSEEEKQAVIDIVIQMIKEMSRLGGPWGPPRTPFPVKPDDLIRLRDDAAYMTGARLLRWGAWYYAELELEEVEVAIDSVLVSLEANLDT